MGKDRKSIYLYSCTSKRAKDITKYFTTDNVSLVGDMLIEKTGPYYYVVYSLDGKRINTFDLPQIGERMSGAIYYDNKEYYFHYNFSTVQHPNPGVVRLSDKKIIYEYNDWGLGYNGPRFVFFKDCYLVTEKSDYVMKIYDYNKTLLREIKHPTFKRKEYSAAEKVIPYPQVQEVYNRGPFYPQVIREIFFANNNIIAVREKRPNEKAITIDMFSYKSGNLLKTISLALPENSKGYVFMADDKNIVVRIIKGSDYYIYIYKL